MTTNEQPERSFFHSVFNLPGSGIFTIGVEATDNSTESPAITISTSALLETLPQLHTSVKSLIISNFALTRQSSDVQAMSKIILAKRATFSFLRLHSIKFPVDDSIKQVSDKPDGFFDLLLHAASGLDNFGSTAKTRSVHSALVSPVAVRARFVQGKEIGTPFLHGLDLTDNHVLAIVDGLSTPGTHLNYLNLDSDPGITTAQGYDALFNLIKRPNGIGSYDLPDKWHGFSVLDVGLG